MDDLGTTTGNANGSNYGVVAAMQAPSEYTIGFNMILRTGGGVNNWVLGNRANGGVTGFSIQTTASNTLFVVHGNGTTIVSSVDGGVMTVGTLHKWLFVWTGADLSIYLDRVLVARQNFTTVIASSPEVFALGGPVAAPLAAAMRIGHLFVCPMAWQTSEIETFFDRKRMPFKSSLSFWATLLKEQNERVSGINPTDIGALTTFDHESDFEFFSSSDQEGAETARALASARLALHGRPVRVFLFKTKLYGLDFQLTSNVAVSHPDGPDAEAKGWERAAPGRHRAKVISRDLDLADGTVTLGLMYTERLTRTLTNTLRNPYGARSVFDGLVSWPYRSRLRSVRNGLANTLDASGFVVRANHNTPRITESGLLVEGQGRNFIQHSGFRVNPGLAGSPWTTEGEGLNGADIALDLTRGTYGPDAQGIIIDSQKFTAGSPLGGTALAVKQIVSGWPAVESVIIIRHVDNSASAPFSLKVQRSSDSFYLTGNNTWSATETWLTVTGSTVVTNFVSVKLTPNGTETISVWVAARTTAGQVNHLDHVQGGDPPFETSLLVTPHPAAVTRPADQNWIENGPDLRFRSNEQGTMWFHFTPFWSTSIPAAADATLVNVFHDSSNFAKVAVRQSDSALVFDVTRAGVSTKAVLTGLTWTKGVRQRVVVRWTGANGELGLSNFTFSVFGGTSTLTKGSDIVGAGTLTESNTSRVWLGSKDGATEFCYGFISNLDGGPIVYDDETVKGLLLE